MKENINFRGGIQSIFLVSVIWFVVSTILMRPDWMIYSALLTSGSFILYNFFPQREEEQATDEDWEFTVEELEEND